MLNQSGRKGGYSSLLRPARAMRVQALVSSWATDQGRQCYPPAKRGAGQAAGPSGARLGGGCRSRSLVRQSCLIPRSPVAVTLSRAVADLTSGQARFVSLGPHRDSLAPASLRSALPPVSPCVARVGSSASPGPLPRHNEGQGAHRALWSEAWRTLPLFFRFGSTSRFLPSETGE